MIVYETPDEWGNLNFIAEKKAMLEFIAVLRKLYPEWGKLSIKKCRKWYYVDMFFEYYVFLRLDGESVRWVACEKEDDHFVYVTYNNSLSEMLKELEESSERKEA